MTLKHGLNGRRILVGMIPFYYFMFSHLSKIKKQDETPENFNVDYLNIFFYNYTTLNNKEYNKGFWEYLKKIRM